MSGGKFHKPLQVTDKIKLLSEFFPNAHLSFYHIQSM